MTLEDYSSTTTPQFFTSIARPEVQAANISYPHSLIQLIQGNLFHGLPNEDPYTHLVTYIEICNTVKIVCVPENVIRLNPFSFSLTGKAKRWLHSFKGNSLRTWVEVVENFLKKYFLESKTAEGKMEISSFHQFPDESLSEALDRFHGLLKRTPTHGYNIAQEDSSREVNYMGAQNRHRFQGYNQGGPSGFNQRRNFTQGLNWRNHPRNHFNKEQRSQPVQNSNQGIDLYEKTNKLKETLNQFMQISMFNYRSTESSIKNLEIQVGQLAKQMAERPTSSFGANIEKNPNEE